jgi:hypothetical protein
MSQHDTLTQALQQIADWDSHTTECAVEYGSNGVRDFYRNIARAALSATQPAQAAQSTHWTEHEPVRLASSRKGRVYLAGPMTGIADFNFPAFNAEADLLRSQGMSVLNPADHGIVAGANWADYLRHDIAGLASCERIHLLRGWSNSKGAQLEVTIANALGMAITYQEGAEEAQAKQSEPAEHWHRLYLEKCQQYNDRVAQLGAEIEGLELKQAAQGAGEVDTGPRVLREVLSVCEDTMDKMALETTEFSRGRAFEAKGISRAIGTWFQDEFCGLSHMGEPVAAPTQPAAGADVLDARWQPIETAPQDMTECVVVRWVDGDGQEHQDFDYTEDGCWVGWHEHAEHVEMIGGHGVSYTPPYQHYMPLPAAPTPPNADQKGAA